MYLNWIDLCVVISVTELSIVFLRSFELPNAPVEIIRVGFNTTSVSVEEEAGIVTVCVVILSGKHFRDFIITAYTLNNTAGLYLQHVVILLQWAMCSVSFW